MPYRNQRDKTANARLKGLVKRNKKYEIQGLRPLSPETKFSQVECIHCGRITGYCAVKAHRHHPNCPLYVRVYWSRKKVS